MIRVITKKPGMVNSPKIERIPNTLKAKQALVDPRGEGALIQRAYAPTFEEQGIDVYVNEEYLFDRDCTPNIELGGTMVQGPVFFQGHDGEGGAIGLTDEQVAFVLLKLRTVVQSIF